MARRRRRKQQKGLTITAGIFTLLLAAAAVLISYGAQWNLPIPTWTEIGAYLGVKQQAQPGDVSGDPLQVHFIDVGNADSTLILADGRWILIDAGENDKGDDVVTYLKRQGVTQLDLVIGTHPHSDHIGGLDDVIKAFPIETLVMPKIPADLVPTTKTYTDVLEAADDKGLAITAAKPGGTYSFGNASFEILSPGKEYDDLNNLSVVTKLTYQNFSALFTGDAEKEVETDLLNQGVNLSANLLKVGHHGSSTSSSEQFLNAVRPVTSVIHVGEGNSYGHPHKETLERLDGLGSAIYRTDLNGTVIVSSDGRNVRVQTQR